MAEEEGEETAADVRFGFIVAGIVIGIITGIALAAIFAGLDGGSIQGNHVVISVITGAGALGASWLIGATIGEVLGGLAKASGSRSRTPDEQ